MCIGYRLAVFEFKAILAALVKEFRFEQVEGAKIVKRVNMDMQPLLEKSGEAKEFPTGTYGLPLRVSVRAQD